MNEKDLIGKTIEKINIDGYGVEIRFTDGTEFVYNASDAGYSGWDISKSGEVGMNNSIKPTQKQKEYTKDAYSAFISRWKPAVKAEDDAMNEPSAWQIQYS